MREGFASLRPKSDVAASSQGVKDSGQEDEAPVLLQNLQAFLADKLQMADRYSYFCIP